jgi:septum site-determining protein MinC
MISIKGLRQGVLIVFEDGANGDLPAHFAALDTKMRQSANFFRGGSVALDVNEFELTPEDLQYAQELLARYEVTLWAVTSKNSTTLRNAQKAGVPTEIQPTKQEEIGPIAGVVFDGTDGILVRKRVRSGQIIRHPGHIVVIGDVNPGAQLIAGSDILVWGKLQGAVHAGAINDNEAIICAMEMTPSVLRINEMSSRVNALSKRNKKLTPEVAKLEQGQIVIVEWNP